MHKLAAICLLICIDYLFAFYVYVTALCLFISCFYNIEMPWIVFICIEKYCIMHMIMNYPTLCFFALEWICMYQFAYANEYGLFNFEFICLEWIGIYQFAYANEYGLFNFVFLCLRMNLHVSICIYANEYGLFNFVFICLEWICIYTDELLCYLFHCLEYICILHCCVCTLLPLFIFYNPQLCKCAIVSKLNYILVW